MNARRLIAPHVAIAAARARRGSDDAERFRDVARHDAGRLEARGHRSTLEHELGGELEIARGSVDARDEIVSLCFVGREPNAADAQEAAAETVAGEFHQ